jgi:uroporphyrinogen decarboxylase
MCAAMDHREPDRVPIQDSWWWEVLDQWRAEGNLPPDVTAEDFFDTDFRPINIEESPQFDHEVLEETDEWVLERDSFGQLQRNFKARQTTPELLDVLGGDREVWEREVMPRMRFASNIRPRLDIEAVRRQAEQWRAEGRWICMQTLDVYEAGWRLIGTEQQLMGFVETSDWLHEVYETVTRLYEDAFAYLVENRVPLDGTFFFGDIAYNKGPFVSPEMYREHVMPYHKRLFALAHSIGGHTIFHTDGDIRLLLPHLIEAGMDAFHPVEAKAGLDVVELKGEYGRDLTFFGNIDARLYSANDLAGLEREIRRKVPVAMKGGGYIYHVDHSVPPGTRFDTYQFVLDLVREVGTYR